MRIVGRSGVQAQYRFIIRWFHWNRGERRTIPLISIPFNIRHTSIAVSPNDFPSRYPPHLYPDGSKNVLMTPDTISSGKVFISLLLYYFIA
jgi:hypothetical protein